MTTAERLPRDHAARAAALDPLHSFLVQAPAGSGKTELLTDRILALLPTVSRPEEIVAITFTRKAASEMHARVLHKLHAAEETDIPPQDGHARRSWILARAALAHDAAMGWNLTKHPARLSIRTIDSFCAGLVRGMPWLSELGGMPGVADDARAHYTAAADATLALADDFDAVRLLLAHLDVDVAAARDAIAGMLGQRDQWLPLLRHGSDRSAMERDLANAISEDLQSLTRAMPPGWAEMLAPAARLAAATLRESGGDSRLDALLDWVDDLTPQALEMARWRAVGHLLLTGEGKLRSPRGVNKNLGFPAGSAHKSTFAQWLESVHPDARWIRFLSTARTMPDAVFSDAQWAILGAQLTTLTLAVAQLRLRFAEKREVDFIEISQRAADALGSVDDPGELLLKLDATIRHLLIDEFQDTSQTQIDLLGTLTSGWQEGDGRSLFLVGDPMQSIYRFRKAEVGLFLQVRDCGLGEIQPTFLQLTDNFRSQAGVVHWVNNTFKSLLPPDDNAPSGAIKYTASEAFNDHLEGDAVCLHPAWGEEDSAEAEWNAESIAVDLARKALEEHAGSAHPVAILVRARGHLARVARRFAHEGIPTRAVELVPLALRPAVADLVQLIRALAHRADRMAWLSVLRAPWCGARLASLEALFGHDHITPIPLLLERALDEQDSGSAPSLESRLPPEEAARLRHIGAILLDTGNASGSIPFAAWVQSLWQRLGGAQLYGAGALGDAESLFLLIERLAPHGAMDVALLDSAVQRLYASPEASGDGAVEIMTMHKSKGLQFDTVILYGLHRTPRAEQPPLVRFEQSAGRVLFGPVKARADDEADPLSRYLGTREKQRTAFEVDRLLYVAATRARKRLHLIGSVMTDRASGEPKAPSHGSLLSRLWPMFSPSPPERAIQTSEASPDVLAKDTRRVQGKALQRLTLAAIQTLHAAPRMAPLDWRLASKRSHTGSNAENAGNAWDAEKSGNTGNAANAANAANAVSVRGDHAAWQIESSYDASIGTLAHAWLARIGEDGVDAWPAESLTARLPLLQRQLTRAGVPDAQAASAAQAVLETLLATLSHDRGRWLLSQAQARREWPLIDAGGKVSVIDLALSTEAGWLIVDYKTGRPHAGESQAGFEARMRERHGEQLARYCAQVSALDNRPARAALYFPRAEMWIDL
jgi:ATP-dependent exoDNAse (exonuclease V) beta subunit